MERAAGNNVVTVKSTRNKVTGAIGAHRHDHGCDRRLGACQGSPESEYHHVGGADFHSGSLRVPGLWPIAAYLIEAFPAKIRYTSLSLPYHIGNGVFGGLLPLIGLSSVAAPAIFMPDSITR